MLAAIEPMAQLFQDAMATVRVHGKPHLFLTMTCNPKWPEIIAEVNATGGTVADRPDIVSRVPTQAESIGARSTQERNSREDYCKASCGGISEAGALPSVVHLILCILLFRGYLMRIS